MFKYFIGCLTGVLIGLIGLSVQEYYNTKHIEYLRTESTRQLQAAIEVEKAERATATVVGLNQALRIFRESLYQSCMTGQIIEYEMAGGKIETFRCTRVDRLIL